MRGTLAPAAAGLPDTLRREGEIAPGCGDRTVFAAWVDGLIRRRREFGISRVGSLTRLDRVGVPVVQVARPLALSNAVSQGKGLNLLAAAASALMEAVETWAAERVPAQRVRCSPADFYGREVIELYAPWVGAAALADWPSRPLAWIEGYDLVSGTPLPVPLPLVEAAYVFPPVHPDLFPRVTTGLGAGRTASAAILHACLEILERDAVARTRITPYFFERFQADLSTLRPGPAATLVAQVREAGLVVGAWRAPARHDLPVFRCHVMEAGARPELAPLPAEGSACRFTDEDALASAVLEACQSRLAAIAGAREDVTRAMYPAAFQRQHLSEWRMQLEAHGPVPVRRDAPGPAGLAYALLALAQAGAAAVVVVPLFSDEEGAVHVVRVIAPPLRLH